MSETKIRQFGFETKEERDKENRSAKAQGYETRRWSMRNQEVGYSGFGTERDMTRRTVYMLDVK